MKHLKITTVLLAASLFTGFGVTSLSACGSCGCSDSKKAVEKPACGCDKKKGDKPSAQSKEGKSCDSK